MVHDPSVGLLRYFNEADLVKVGEELKVIKQSIVNGYALKTGKDADEIAAIMTAETWYDGKQAVDAGFCDKIMFEEADTTVENTAKVIVNSVSLDISRFPNLPVSLLNRCATHTQDGFSDIQHQNEPKRSEEIMDGIKDIKTVDGLKAAFPDLTKQIEDAATAAERKRIQDIEDVALPGFEISLRKQNSRNPLPRATLRKRLLRNSASWAASTFRTATTTRRTAARAKSERAQELRGPAARAARTKSTRRLTSFSPKRSKEVKDHV